MKPHMGSYTLHKLHHGNNNIEMENIVEILWLLATQTVVSGPAALASPGH